MGIKKIFCFWRKEKKKVRNTRKDVPKELLHFYCQSAEEVASFFEVDLHQGLTDKQVEDSRSRWGQNLLKKKGGVKLWQIVFHNFVNFMSGVLFVAFILSMATEQWVEAGVVMFIIVINALIGTFQEFKSEKTMAALQKMSSPTSRVLRNGQKTEIFSSDIVPGDIVLLREGDKLPADMRLFEVVTLECDEALLTGESLPVEKTVEPLENEDTELGDRTNVAFMSSSVTKGKGKGIVVYTGQRTEIGMIADSVSKNKKDGTNLEKRMMRLGMVLAVSALLAVVAVMIAWWQNDTGPIYPEGLEVAVSTAVALIPEALVPVITLTLTMGVRRMYQQKAIVRKLNSLEQLGGITDVCSDKTGTLTQGKMMATDLWIPPQRRYEIDGKGFDPSSGTIRMKGEEVPRYSIDTSRVSVSMERVARMSMSAERRELPRPSVDIPRPSIERYHPSMERSGGVVRPSVDVPRPSTDRTRPSSDRARPSSDKSRPSGERRRSGVLDRVRKSIDVRRPSTEHARLMDESEDSEVEADYFYEEEKVVEMVPDNDRSLHMAMLISSLCNSSAIQLRPPDEEDKDKKEGSGRTWWKPWTWCNGCCTKKNKKGKERVGDEEEGEVGEEGESEEKKKEGEWIPIGTPTEAALLVLAIKLQYTREELDKDWKDVAEYPFDSTVKLMSVVKKNPQHNAMFQFTKGAPERLLPLCTRLNIEGELVELGEEELEAVKHVNEEMGNDGLRVIALAYKELDSRWDPEGQDRTEDVEKDLIFVGLVGIKDPPRDGVVESIRMCHEAGITVRMLTGDHPVTAMAIARQIGILDYSRDDQALTSAEFDKLTEEELDEMDELPLVIARCSPQSKVKMVEQLHHNKKVVAMTGDGVNDAPAISSADVGISMGIAGTDVTKEASDIVLADDDFNTIVKAIMEGRRIHANIRKFIVHLLVGNISQAVLIIIAILADFPPPLNPIQVLWLNMITGTPPALALGMEPASPDLMNVKKRAIGEPLFTPGTIMDILWYGIFMGALTLGNFIAMVNAFHDENGAQATAYISLTFMLLLHGYNCRRLKNSAFSNSVWKAWPFHLALLLGFVSVMFTVFVPVINTEVFGQDNPGWQGWSLSIGSCIVFMICCEIYKVVRWLLRKFYVMMMRRYGGWKTERVKTKKMKAREKRRNEAREKAEREEEEQRRGGGAGKATEMEAIDLEEAKDKIKKKKNKDKKKKKQVSSSETDSSDDSSSSEKQAQKEKN